MIIGGGISIAGERAHTNLSQLRVDRIVPANSCISYGNHELEDSKGNSIFIGNDLHLSDDQNNVNIGNFLEANTETGDVLFPKVVCVNDAIYLKDEFCITHLDICDGCLLASVGFRWNAQNSVGNMCLNCIRNIVLMHHAKEQWIEKNGDPIYKLQLKIYELENKINEIKNNC